MKDFFERNKNYMSIYSLESEYNSNIGENKGELLREPIVSSFLIKKGYTPEYPENSSFAICLTHDIDEVYTPLIHRAHSMACTFTTANVDNLDDAFRGILDKRKCKYLDFGKIMFLEEKYNSKSTFFFLTEKNDPVRFRYDIEDVCNKFGEIKDRGFEIGLHGGYYAYDDIEILADEKRRLEKGSGIVIEGYRSHYLNLHIPRTWLLLSKLGFRYDTTLGYRRDSGFRNGMCHPFHPYIRERDEELDLLEIPLIIMDAAFPSLSFKASKYWEKISNIINVVEKNHGVLAINWHNDSLLSTRKIEHYKMYEKILSEGLKKKAWISNCHDIYKWWTLHSKEFESRIIED